MRVSVAHWFVVFETSGWQLLLLLFTLRPELGSTLKTEADDKSLDALLITDDRAK